MSPTHKPMCPYHLPVRPMLRRSMFLLCYPADNVSHFFEHGPGMFVDTRYC